MRLILRSLMCLIVTQNIGVVSPVPALVPTAAPVLVLSREAQLFQAPLYLAYSFGSDGLTVIGDPLSVTRRDLQAFVTASSPAEREDIDIREAWREFFGVDVWLPYYTAKEIEGWVRKKCEVKICRLKGGPVFDQDRAFFVFKSIF